MALNQHYTWANFLQDNPDLKKKKMKRTSSDGAKAFEAAFKKHIKEYLKNRLEKIDALKKSAQKHHTDLTKKCQSFAKAKKWPKAKVTQLSIGRQDAWLSSLDQQATRTKTLQKNF